MLDQLPLPPVATPAARTEPFRPARARTALVALATVLACLAGLVTAAAPADARSLPRRTLLEASIGRSVLALLNAERALHGLRPLRMNSYLQLSARRHDLAMARANTMSHQLPREAFFADRITAAGYRWRWAGENIGWNSLMSRTGVLALEQIMYNERPPNDGHRQNILSRNYRDVGVDVYFDRTHHKVWLTTDFGRH